jgi:hypothetical protein
MTNFYCFEWFKDTFIPRLQNTTHLVNPSFLFMMAMDPADAVVLMHHFLITIENLWCKYTDTKCIGSDASLTPLQSQD